MENQVANTLPKKERLCGKKGIESLLARGKHGNAGAIRYIYTLDNGEEFNRILISVPKKLFKRAVKRNLLKRRIRESWRRLKGNLNTANGIDILFLYSTKEILSYQEIYDIISGIVIRLAEKSNRQDGKQE